MRSLLLPVLTLIAGCASYLTPGGPANLDAINRADIAEIASRKPAATFPAHIVVARVQAPNYRSHSSDPLVTGSYSIVTTQEQLSSDMTSQIGSWPQVAAVAAISRLLLPARVESLENLRLAAAKLQADIVLLYTIDTSFRVQGRGYGPLAAISLGLVPDRDAFISSTASAIFVDVRTGFVYGVADATSRSSGLSNAWGTRDLIDRKRVAAESEAFGLLVVEAEKTWTAIAKRHAS